MSAPASMFSARLIVPAIGEAFRKLKPAELIRNPVLFTTAEWDNARYLWPQAAVYKELIDKHGARPRYKQSPGHNHSSQLWSLGTSDTSVSRELVDFIERTVKH